MKTLYNCIAEDLPSNPQRRIKGGGSCMGLYFDLNHGSIYSKKLCIMRNGKLIRNVVELDDGERLLLSEEYGEFHWNEIQGLYDQYVHSVPAKATNYSKGYFRPLTSDELTFEELVTGMDRTEARYRLEAYLLLGIVSGQLQWMNEANWFYRGQNGMILYRDWFVNDTHTL